MSVFASISSFSYSEVGRCTLSCRYLRSLYSPSAWAVVPSSAYTEDSFWKVLLQPCRWRTVQPPLRAGSRQDCVYFWHNDLPLNLGDISQKRFVLFRRKVRELTDTIGLQKLADLLLLSRFFLIFATMTAVMSSLVIVTADDVVAAAGDSCLACCALSGCLVLPVGSSFRPVSFT